MVKNIEATPTFKEIQEQKKNKLDYIYYPGSGLQSSVVTTQLEHSFIESFLGKIYSDVIPVQSQDDAYEKMRQERLPQQVFIEGYDFDKAKEITENAKQQMKEGIVRLEYSSFNRLRFNVISEAPAIFGLSYPYTGKWRAWVNGEKVHIYRANGASHAVEIPKGKSMIEFRYWSNAAFYGMVISFVTFSMIGVFVFIRGGKGLLRIFGTLTVLLIGIGGFILWYKSLYTGNNLKTQYEWKYSPPLKDINLAYGKKIWVEPLPTWWWRKMDPWAREFSETRLVDGNRSPGSGFSTILCNPLFGIPAFFDNPSLFLDLNEDEKIKAIVLYEGEPDPSVNIRPLEIALSQDGFKWNIVASVESPTEPGVPTRVDLEHTQTARFIRIRGKECLKFDEIEVYSR